MPQKRRPKSAQRVRYAGQRTTSLPNRKAKQAEPTGSVESMASAPQVAAAESAPISNAVFASRTGGEAVLSLAGTGISGAATPANEAARTGRRSKSWTVGRVLRWVFGLTGFAVLAVGAYVVYLFIDFQNGVYTPVPATPTAVVAVLPTQPTVAPGKPTSTMLPTPTPDFVRQLPAGRFNILVMGTDVRVSSDEQYGRSDSIVMVNVDSISHTVRLMSIPRDLIVEIPDYGQNKVNAAYLFGEYYKEPGGGKALAMRTMSDFFNVAVDYYVTINFDGLKKVVDEVGGIDINVPYELDDYQYPSDDEGDLYGTIHVHFDEGRQHMDGKTALRYARTRHADNDYARSRRQLQVVMAIRQKAMSLDLLPSVPSILRDLSGMVQTNIPWDQQLGLAQLAFNMSSSSIITAAIDSTLVTADYLPDGSEGLRLNEKRARHMFDEFFGFDAPTPTPIPKVTATPTANNRATVTPVPTRRNATPIPTPTRRR
ncbi:MAG: LCP family protein [Chloroflexia bacterium]